MKTGAAVAVAPAPPKNLSLQWTGNPSTRRLLKLTWFPHFDVKATPSKKVAVWNRKALVLLPIRVDGVDPLRRARSGLFKPRLLGGAKAASQPHPASMLVHGVTIDLIVGCDLADGDS